MSGKRSIILIILLTITFFCEGCGRPDPDELIEWVNPYYMAHHGGIRTNKEIAREINRLEDVNVFSQKHQETLLGAACRMKNGEIIELLLKKGANPNPPQGTPPLHYAVSRNGTPELAEALVAAGADPRRISEHGETALHHAAMDDSVWGVRWLLAHGVDASVVSNYGETALDVARRKGYTKIVGILSSPEVQNQNLSHQPEK